MLENLKEMTQQIETLNTNRNYEKETNGNSRPTETMQSDEQKEKTGLKKNEQNFRMLWDSWKYKKDRRNRKAYKTYLKKQ